MAKQSKNAGHCATALLMLSMAMIAATASAALAESELLPAAIHYPPPIDIEGATKAAANMDVKDVTIAVVKVRLLDIRTLDAASYGDWDQTAIKTPAASSKSR